MPARSHTRRPHGLRLDALRCVRRRPLASDPLLRPSLPPLVRAAARTAPVAPGGCSRRGPGRPGDRRRPPPPARACTAAQRRGCAWRPGPWRRPAPPAPGRRSPAPCGREAEARALGAAGAGRAALAGQRCAATAQTLAASPGQQHEQQVPRQRELGAHLAAAAAALAVLLQPHSVLLLLHPALLGVHHLRAEPAAAVAPSACAGGHPPWKAAGRRTDAAGVVQVCAAHACGRSGKRRGSRGEGGQREGRWQGCRTPACLPSPPANLPTPVFALHGVCCVVTQELTASSSSSSSSPSLMTPTPRPSDSPCAAPHHAP